MNHIPAMTSSSTPLITLCTDFGLEDEYVGVLKGVLLSRLPEARLVDLSHGVEPGDVAGAARLLLSALPWFPPHAVHLVVVDPGVGGERHILAARCGLGVLVGPDNGVLHPLLQAAPPARIHRLDNPAFYPPRPSATFHGRDIMAPVAAALAGGLDLDEVGPALGLEDITPLDLPRARLDATAREVRGQVTHADRFGNLITNIKAELLQELGPIRDLEARLNGLGLPLATHYGAVPPGRPLALVSSRGFLEVAVNQGRAADLEGCGPGSAVLVRRSRDRGRNHSAPGTTTQGPGRLPRDSRGRIGADRKNSFSVHWLPSSTR